MKRFKKIYLEITNRCNLSCAFCPGTKRTPKTMSTEEFTSILPKITPFTDYVYFHLMGEPFFHPDLGKFISLAHDAGLKVILTTNGTLLSRWKNEILSLNGLHKVNISLHSFEANDLSMPFSKYLDECFSFGKEAEGKIIVSYRLWNSGGLENKNGEIIRGLEKYFPKPWHEERMGPRIGEKIYINYGEKFDWPDLSAEDGGENVFCYGLKDQLGILCDGTVVPCCLDHEGDIALGNIFAEELGDILVSPRVQNMISGFNSHRASEELCRRCGYARAKFG